MSPEAGALRRPLPAKGRPLPRASNRCQIAGSRPWEWASAPVRDAERYEEMRKRSAHDP